MPDLGTTPGPALDDLNHTLSGEQNNETYSLEMSYAHRFGSAVDSTWQPPNVDLFQLRDAGENKAFQGIGARTFCR